MLIRWFWVLAVLFRLTVVLVLIKKVVWVWLGC